MSSQVADSHPVLLIPPTLDFDSHISGFDCSLFIDLRYTTLIVIVHVLNSQAAESPTLAAFSEFIAELDAPSSSSSRKSSVVVEYGRPFTPAMFEGS
ncbi:unnamed protein product [Cochlearia groenlandica]